MPIKDQVCHWCKKRGHLPRVCQSKSKTFPPTQRTQSKRPTLKPTRQVGEESEDNSEDSMQPIYTLEQGQDTPPAAPFHPWSWLPSRELDLHHSKSDYRVAESDIVMRIRSETILWKCLRNCILSLTLLLLLLCHQNCH